MRGIRYTRQFKRDYKREKTGRYKKLLDVALMGVVNCLIADLPLPSHNADHPLYGKWADYRDCHIKPDLILVYRKSNNKYLDLVRLGSHEKLGF